MRVIHEPSSSDAFAFVFSNSKMRQVHQQAIQAASSSHPLILRGEKGVGKRTLARIIHRSSGCNGPFVEVNCGHLREEMQHRELFGCENSREHGSRPAGPGKLQFAVDGTLFIDGEVAPSAQHRLLEQIRDKQEPSSDRNVKGYGDWRLIMSLGSKPGKGDRFDTDPYHELGVVEIGVPPLRSRRDEIPLLCDFFLRRLGNRYGGLPPALPEAVMKQLEAQDWAEGNLDELEEAIKAFLRESGRIPASSPTIPDLPDMKSGHRR